MSASYLMVGLGELLWDLLPTGKQLGGAPANFAYFSNLLGDEGWVASRVGTDALGGEARARLRVLGACTDCLQVDGVHSTGTVQVQVDAAGQPQFDIKQPVAWDFFEWTPQWEALARRAQAVCFGSLAQRSPCSRATILHFLRATSTQT